MADEAKVEVYRDDANEWRWRVRATNGQVIGVSEEGYKNRGYCLKVAEERNPGLAVVER